MCENNKSLMAKKVSVWHIVYIITICVLVVIFFLLLAPGKINDEAYHNFSFAATITSIVLAVVSIVYSIVSGISTIGHIGRIKNIEENISKEVEKFSRIDEAIKEALSPINKQIGDLQKAQDLMTSKQDLISEGINKFNDNRITLQLPRENGQTQTIVAPPIVYLVLYAAALSKEKDMDIPYHKFAEVIGGQAKYCEGLLDGIAALNPDNIKVEQGSRFSRKKVTEFNEEYWGSKDELKDKVRKETNGKLSEVLMSKIDDYYSDPKNQLPSDII